MCSKAELPLLLNHAEQVAKGLKQILKYPSGSQSSFFLRQMEIFSMPECLCVFFVFKKTFCYSFAAWAFLVHPHAERGLGTLDWITINQGGTRSQRWLLFLSFLVLWRAWIKSKASWLDQVDSRSNLFLFFWNPGRTKFWKSKQINQETKDQLYMDPVSFCHSMKWSYHKQCSFTSVKIINVKKYMIWGEKQGL